MMTRTLSIASFGLLATLFFVAAATAAPVTLQTSKSEKYGTYLTDSQGRSLYMFEADKQGKGKERAESNCYDACAKAWPPLIADGTPQAGPGVNQSLIGTVERKDGSRQVTYNGWPLYYFIKDKAPGQTAGQDVKGFGGEWYLLSPEGKPIHAAK